MSILHIAYSRIREHFRLFVQDEEGASGIEYALLAAMVGAILALFVTPVGDQILATMNDILTAMGGTAVTN
ncbi:Flp family type IVb pilin [Marinobacterium aestuariivivens]|uniref:Flp family type IVb pilin n=1 Tax=Marinobacterium aestuariivivens TaxID=1698799 RepID=A0ABW2A154_9GAMM